MRERTMKANILKKKEIESFDQFIKTFYPLSENKTVEEQNPRDVGIGVARSTLAKYEHLFHKKQKTKVA